MTYEDEIAQATSMNEWAEGHAMEYFKPNRMQIQSAVKGDDRYVPVSRFPMWVILVAACLGMGVLYGLAWLLSEWMK